MRWFFRCAQCVRRCSYLYAPRSGSFFACRRCHDLSYESAQTWDHVQRTGRFPGLFGRLMDDIAAGGDGSRVTQRLRPRRCVLTRDCPSANNGANG